MTIIEVVGAETSREERTQMTEYLESQGHHFLSVDGGVVFYKDEGGRVWGSAEVRVIARMKERGIDYKWD